MKLTIKSGGVPAGSYAARFIGVEQRESVHGPGLLWAWEVLKGPHAGAKVTGFTGDSPTPNNKCGRFLAGLLGGKLPPTGEVVDPSTLADKQCLVTVEQS